MSSVSPGPWLRLTALFAVAGALIAVISGAVGGDLHRAASALAVPPLVALVVAGWVAHRRLLPWALAALVSFGAAAAVTQPVVHVALASAALAACVVAAAQAFRGEPVYLGRVAWRDYVTLTKPRIMSLLLITGAGGMFVGAQGVPPLVDPVRPASHALVPAERCLPSVTGQIKVSSRFGVFTSRCQSASSRTAPFQIDRTQMDLLH